MEGERLRVLLIGSGGREHALAWKLSQSPLVDSIKVVPGNGGTAEGLYKVANVASIDPDNFSALLAFARKHNVNLVIPGPEAPLVAGISDVFRAAGIRCFGPSKAAARMEGSKAFAKTFMAKYGIPTARYETFNEYEEAKEYLENVSHDVVIKASGLAAGKGVILPISKAEAHAALKHLMLDKQFGSAGDEVVIEERLKGRELSFLSFSDGYTIRTLPPGQDHKKIFDSDCGPNTGGMGAYAPSPLATPQLIEEVHRTILQPTIDGMRAEKMPFKGLLFTGLMIVEDGRPMTLEYNVRFGDPETQTMLPLMDCDLAEVMVACTDTYLSHVNIKAHSLFSTTVVASAGGYPGPYVRGDEITITSPPPDTYIFHAGTNPPTAIEAEHDSAHSVPSQNPSTSLTTSGGRVIAATSTNRDLAKAISQAYDGISTIEFANMHYRKDIGKTGLELQTTQNRLDSSEKFTYASAGVSIASGNTFVKSIISLVASTARPGILPYLGGFGAVVDLAAAGYHPLSPRLVLGADGVGTKLKIAHAIGKHDTIGIDLVAMNVNDLVVQGAEPLAFLDVYSCGKLDPDVALEVVKGICAGCREACCVLPGGETAEMSGLFLNEDAYDVVGFAMGAIEQGRLVLPTKDRMNVGDILLGLESNGCHSNGFSLIRKIIECSGLKYSDRAPWNIEEFVGESLLLPTRIYVRPLLEVVRKDLVKGMAHITGGGLIENIPRMLPKHLAAEIDVTAWEIPKVLRWLKDQGRMEHQEFARVFNTGLGMILLVSPENVQETLGVLKAAKETVHVVGKVIERRGEGCVLENLASWD